MSHKERIIKAVTDQYLETALWAETNSDDYPDDNCPPPWDQDYDCGDFTSEAKGKAWHDCKVFLEKLESTKVFVYREGETFYTDLYDAISEFADDEQIGHDFWLTRNGHGAGFWDGDYRDANNDWGEIVTRIVKEGFAECNLCAAGSGQVEFL